MSARRVREEGVCGEEGALCCARAGQQTHALVPARAPPLPLTQQPLPLPFPPHTHTPTRAPPLPLTQQPLPPPLPTTHTHTHTGEAAAHLVRESVRLALAMQRAGEADNSTAAVFVFDEA